MLISIRLPQVRLRPPAAVNLHRRVEDDALAARDGLVNNSQFGLEGLVSAGLRPLQTSSDKILSRISPCYHLIMTQLLVYSFMFFLFFFTTDRSLNCHLSSLLKFDAFTILIIHVQNSFFVFFLDRGKSQLLIFKFSHSNIDRGRLRWMHHLHRSGTFTT